MTLVRRAEFTYTTNETRACSPGKTPFHGGNWLLFTHNPPRDSLLKLPDNSLWQRNYYEHIIRSQTELDANRLYIRSNPLQWHTYLKNPTLPSPRQSLKKTDTRFALLECFAPYYGVFIQPAGSRLSTSFAAKPLFRSSKMVA